VSVGAVCSVLQRELEHVLYVCVLVSCVLCVCVVQRKMGGSQASWPSFFLPLCFSFTLSHNIGARVVSF
jgi:hypothetical protein